MANYSSVLAWRIPGTAEPGGLLSVGLQRVGYNWSDLAAAASYEVILDKGICISGGEQKVTYFAGILWDLKITFTAILTNFMSVNVLWSSKAQCQWMQKIRVRRDMPMPWGILFFTCFSPILSIFPSWIPEHWALFWSFRRGLYAVRKEDNMGPLQVDSQGMMV